MLPSLQALVPLKRAVDEVVIPAVAKAEIRDRIAALTRRYLDAQKVRWAGLNWYRHYAWLGGRIGRLNPGVGLLMHCMHVLPSIVGTLVCVGSACGLVLAPAHPHEQMLLVSWPVSHLNC